MPTYSEDQRSPGPYFATDTDLQTGETHTSHYSTALCNGVVKRFSGSNSGRFVPGVYRVNGMSASRTTYVYANSSNYIVYTLGGSSKRRYELQGYCTSRSPIRSSTTHKTWDDGMMGYVVQRAYSELLSGDMDMGEFLAELPETIRMVTGGVRLLTRAIQNATRNGFTWSRADRARRALLEGASLKSLNKKVASAWLTWRYGIRPLIWDVQDIVKVANGIADQSSWTSFQRRRARVSRALPVKAGTSYSFQAPYQRMTWRAVENVEVEQKGEATVYFRFGASWGPYQNLLLKYGLHPNQFPYLLWQLRPLSFMLDWFVDVGTWVRAITPKPGMEIFGCSASQKTTIRVSRTCVVEDKPSVYAHSTNPIHDVKLVESIERRPQSLSGAIPRLKPDICLSIQQQADILAVLLQRALNQRRR